MGDLRGVAGRKEQALRTAGIYVMLRCTIIYNVINILRFLGRKNILHTGKAAVE